MPEPKLSCLSNVSNGLKGNVFLSPLGMQFDKDISEETIWLVCLFVILRNCLIIFVTLLSPISYYLEDMILHFFTDGALVVLNHQHDAQPVHHHHHLKNYVT